MFGITCIWKQFNLGHTLTNCLTLVLAKISQILNWFQILNLPWELHKIVVIILLLLLVFNMLEVCCYAILFHHIYHHDNNIAILILNPDVIKVRNTRNAISLVGQLSSWILEASYALLSLYFTSLDYQEPSRELASFLKLSEFTLIPLVQIFCSPPLRYFVLKHNRLL